jgi:hypothetical protein
LRTASRKPTRAPKRVTLRYPPKPKKGYKQCSDEDRNPKPDSFLMAVFAW